MIVSTLAAMADPIKIAISLFVVISINYKNELGFCSAFLLCVIYLFVGYQSSMVRDNWLIINIISIVLWSAGWGVLLLILGRWATGVVAGVAALVAVAAVMFAVSTPKTASCLSSTCPPQLGGLPVTDSGSRAKVLAAGNMPIQQSPTSYARDSQDGAKAPFIDLNVGLDPREPVKDSSGISVVGASEEHRTESLAWSVANSYRDASFVPLVGSAIDLARAVRRSFIHGDNIAVNVLQDLKRAAISGSSDDQWNDERRAKFADQNAKSIPANQRWRYMATRNEVEARLLLADTEADVTALNINAYFGG